LVMATTSASFSKFVITSREPLARTSESKGRKAKNSGLPLSV
jgi:hypothetical protein